MAKRFLTHLDLSGNQLLNATFEKLASDPSTDNFEGRMYYNSASGVVRLYDGTASAWVGLGAIKNILGTANRVTVDIDENEIATISLPNSIDVNAATATKLETARTISLGGDLSGSASFDGTQNITITASVDSESSVKSLTGTTGEVDVSASVGNVTVSLPSTLQGIDTTGNAATATALETGRTIALGGDLSGSASFDGTENITITATVQPDSVALGTDTTGDYVASVSASDGILATGTGEGAAVSLTNTDKGSSQNIFKTISSDSGSINAGSNSASVTFAGGTGISTDASSGTVTITNDGVVDITGTTNEIEVSASVGSVIVGLPDNVKITEDLEVGGDLTVAGDLTVSGSVTFLDTEHLRVKDNIITLNYGISASVAPTLDAGIEVARGSASTVSLIWNETLDTWQATRDGSTFNSIILDGDIVGTSSIDVSSSAGVVTVDTILKSANSYLTSASGLAVDITALESKLVTDSFTRKATANVGNGSATSFNIDHNFDTKDVVVQVYDNATDDTVEVDVVRTTTNRVTVSFSVAPTNNAYRVVVIG
jgi:hypothetical protein